MLEHGDRIVVAVSGGADSVVLLDALARLKDSFSLELTVAHYDHGLRPSEDEDETRFVSEIAQKNGFLCVSEKARVPLKRPGISLEEAARDSRYAFLKCVKDQVSAQKVALGHTLDDQAETVIMRLLRGSGSAGLSGILPVRDHMIIRPLIALKREDINRYIAARKLHFITDSSNLEKRYLRNAIRMDLLPLLKKYSPGIVPILGQTAEVMRQETDFIQSEAKKWIKGISGEDPKGHVLPIAMFRELSEGLQGEVIRQMIMRTAGSLRRISFDHVEAIKALTRNQRPQAFLNLPNHLIVRRTYDTLHFYSTAVASEKKEVEGYQYVLKGPGIFDLKTISCRIAIREIKHFRSDGLATSSPWRVHLNAKEIRYPLYVRNFRPGDRFVPFGMTGHKKLKDFFAEKRLPFHLRKQIPLLCTKSRLIWVCGMRIDDRYKVVPGAANTIEAHLIFPEGQNHWLQGLLQRP